MEQTIQQRIKAKLEASGLPHKLIQCYGSQIVVTTHCRDTAIKWGTLLAQFARVKRTALESIDEASEQRGSCLNRTYVKVWRTYAVIDQVAA